MQFMLMFYENEPRSPPSATTADRAGPYWGAWNAYVNGAVQRQASSSRWTRSCPLQRQHGSAGRRKRNGAGRTGGGHQGNSWVAMS